MWQVRLSKVTYNTFSVCVCILGIELKIFGLLAQSS